VRSSRKIFAAAGIALLLAGTLGAAGDGSKAKWKNGPPNDPAFFPIAVWLQDPKNAERYKAAGINTYVGLWRGPTQAQLDTLKQAGMSVICGQNAAGIAAKDDPTIIGWMHGDEPDNAQSLPGGKGYGPPITTARIIEHYQQLREADPTRPVLLNLGQGVAWDNYIGRGVRRNHPEDYRDYLKGCDIASFDIYPAVHTDPAIAGKLEYVANGVDRLRSWSDQQKPIWNCIECTHIGNADTKPTPEQVRSEVWMSIIHGSRGIIYFVHQFKPVFREAALLDDKEMLGAITEINRQILELAPVLNSAATTNRVEVTTPRTGQISVLVRHYGEATYLLTVNMRGENTHARFQLPDQVGQGRAEVLHEGKAIPVDAGQFEDEFRPYGVHLYRVNSRKD